jgi:hypothetical protein
VAPADCGNCEWGLTENKWKWSFLGWFVRLVPPVQEIFVLPWLLNRPSTKYFFLAYLSIPLSPLPSKLGRQTCWAAFLLLCVSGLLSNPVSHGSLETGEGLIFRWFTVPSAPLEGDVLMAFTSPCQLDIRSSVFQAEVFVMVDYSLYWRFSSAPNKWSLTTCTKENLREAHYMSYLFFPLYRVKFSCECPLIGMWGG